MTATLRDQLKRPASMWLLALITLSGTLAMHIFVPALPGVSRDLGTSMAEAQLTISVYMLGLAVGQLAYGPISDRLGRRPVIMAGLAIYVLASLAGIFAEDIHVLLASRFVQALGGCSGLVLGRAIVRDTASAEGDSTRRLAVLNLMVVVGPAMAPVAGSILVSHFAWRSVMLAVAILGSITLVLTWRLLSETGRRERGSAFARHYFSLLRSRAFLCYSLGGGLATTPLFAFLAAAPFIFLEQLHRPFHEIGFYLALPLVGVWFGNLMATRLVDRIGTKALLKSSSFLSVLATLTFLAFNLSGNLSLGVTLATIFVFTIGMGATAPSALSRSISTNLHVIGSASGLYGFIQMLIGAICTVLVGLGSDPALSAAFVLAGASTAGQISFWLADPTRR